MTRKVGASSSKYNKIDMDTTLDKLNAAVEKLILLKENIDILNYAIGKSPLVSGCNDRNTNTRETGHLLLDEVVGRVDDKEKVLKWLSEPEGDGRGSARISALTIWGIGGLGKTTLAQSVFSDDTLNFQVRMWVCVSNTNLEMVELMKKAIETQTEKLPTATSLSSLQDKLKNIVQSKKCLLVLDDVWDGQDNQNQQQWENFLGILSQSAESGSKVLVTSRMKYRGLPKRISNDFLPLSCLEKDQSLALFYKHAFDGVNPSKHTNLNSVGDKIATKCGGLPLALKVVGGLLNTNLDISYWLSISEKNILNLDEDMDYVKDVLKLSYQCLPSNLQSCFRVCCLFPQDYRFEKDELVTLWMGLGCINQSIYENTQPEDIARSYLEILVRRSLFIYDYKSAFYTMHDLLHDLAQDVSKGECLRVEGDKSVNLPKRLRHLFFEKLNSSLVKEICSLKSLRTLALSYPYHPSCFYASNSPNYDEIIDFLKQLKSLRALFISCKTMPNLSVIENLRRLRLFHMKADFLNKPIKPLNKLYQLQNLNCEEPSNLQDVHNGYDPVECDGIYDLVKLKHLILPSRIFDQISLLTNLIELQEVEVHLKEDNALKLSDLKDLNKLRHLGITDEREITSFEEAKEANIEKKEHLEIMSLSFKLKNCDCQFHEQLWNFLQPKEQSKIKDLKLSNYGGVVAPSWMTSDYLPYMTHLKISDCDKLEHLPPLGQLPSLKVLALENMAGVIHTGTEFFGNDNNGGFPSLEELQINNMVNLKEWTRADSKRWFPFLSKLDITDCQQLKALPALPLSLKKLYLDLVGLVSLPQWYEEDETSPSLEELKIRSCKELVHVQPFLRKCVSLEVLSIKKSPKILAGDESNCLDVCDGLSSLTTLEIGDFASIKIINCIKVISLQKLSIEACENLMSLNDLPNLTALTKLSVTKCDNLMTSSSAALSEASDQAHSPFAFGIKDIAIDNVLLLLQIEPLRSTKSAKKLMFGDVHVSCLPHQWLLQNHTSLTMLSICHCPLLESLPNELPSSLETLHFTKCALLKSLPENMPSSLRSLKIWGCPLLKSLPEIISLEYLHIGGCSLIELLLQRHPPLKKLAISYMLVLKSLPESISVERLNIWGCPVIEFLPGKILSSLEYLCIRSCTLLAQRYKRERGTHSYQIAHIPHHIYE